MTTPRGITAVVAIPGSVIGRTPAAVDPKTGVCYINADRWNQAHPDQRLFWLLHEMGHVYNQSGDEYAADRFASEHYLKFWPSVSMEKSVLALTDYLRFNKPEDYYRANEHYQRLKEATDKMRLSQYHTNYFQSLTGSTDNIFNLFGSKKRRDQRLENKDDKQDAKTELILARADKKRDKGEAAKTRAEKGEGGVGGLISKGLDTIGGIVGGRKTESSAAPAGTNPDPDAKTETNYTPYIIGGIAILVVIVVIIVLVKGKKGGAPKAGK